MILTQNTWGHRADTPKVYLMFRLGQVLLYAGRPAADQRPRLTKGPESRPLGLGYTLGILGVPRLVAFIQIMLSEIGYKWQYSLTLL